MFSKVTERDLLACSIVLVIIGLNQLIAAMHPMLAEMIEFIDKACIITSILIGIKLKRKYRKRRTSWD